MRRHVDDLADEKRQKIISIIKKSNYYSLIEEVSAIRGDEDFVNYQ